VGLLAERGDYAPGSVRGRAALPRMEECMNSQPARIVIVVALMLAVCLPAVYAQQSSKKEHTFRGKIEKVDTKAKILTVNGENVEGWMGAMTMNYAVDKADVLDKVKVGDQITAKVYDGDFKTLYDVHVVPENKK
jgi:Cu/Ag efflux protein CusF